MAAEHCQKVFTITSGFLAISSIFRNLAKMKEFKEDGGELFVLLRVLGLFPFQFFQPEASSNRHGLLRRISRQKFPKRTRILSIPSKPHSFHSVHSAIGSRMNGISDTSFIPKTE